VHGFRGEQAARHDDDWGPFHLEVDQMLEPAGAGARLTVRCRADSRGFFRLAEPLVIRLAKKQFETGGENLKALLEEHAL
jgi:hypothetical protein